MTDPTQAIEKAAEALSKAIDLLRDLAPFLRRVLGDSLESFGGILSDWASYFRYKNLLAIRDRVEAIHVKRNLQGKALPIPPRYAIPLIEAASLEDDPDIRTLWANLIANATDPNTHLKLAKIHIDTLKAFEPLDAAIMDHLYRNWAHTLMVPEEAPENADTISEALDCDPEEVKISLQNLYRLGCLIDTAGEAVFDTEFPYVIGLRVNNPRSNFRLSHFGRSLYEACHNG